jgi:hypothetical protein
MISVNPISSGVIISRDIFFNFYNAFLEAG